MSARSIVYGMAAGAAGTAARKRVSLYCPYVLRKKRVRTKALCNRGPQ
jgi:hypothetical protein